MQTGRNMADTSPSPVVSLVTSSYEIFSNEGGNCFVEANVLYASASLDDDFAHYYTHSFEKCCSDCNRLAICLSWTYSLDNQTCTLKRAFRSAPTLLARFVSGFKPNELYSLSIARGLEFVNLDTDSRLDKFALMAINLPNSTVSINVKSYIEAQVTYSLFILYTFISVILISHISQF